MLSTAMVLGAILLALPARGKTPVTAIQRNVNRLARTRMADQNVTLIDRGNFAVWVRPGRGVIGVSRGLRQEGFLLGRDGKLSATDQVRLGQLIQTHAPGTSRNTVRQTLAAEIGRFRVRERLLKQQDPLIQSVLKRAFGSTSEQLLWQGHRAMLSYRPGSNVLEGATTWTRQGFFVTRGPDGLKVQDRSLQALRQFLLQHRY